MGGTELGMAALGFVVHEAMLLAACGFLLLGASDLAVDLIWLGRAGARRCRRFVRASAATLAPPACPGLLAVFIPAWDESVVIGDMLSATLARFGEADYRLYVGCYPNDPATIAAVEAIGHPRLRLVVGPRPGPTTKADCLNQLWAALLADEAAGIM